jgi:hypothetical protein
MADGRLKDLSQRDDFMVHRASRRGLARSRSLGAMDAVVLHEAGRNVR